MPTRMKSRSMLLHQLIIYPKAMICNKLSVFAFSTRVVASSLQCTLISGHFVTLSNAFYKVIPLSFIGSWLFIIFTELFDDFQTGNCVQHLRSIQLVSSNAMPYTLNSSIRAVHFQLVWSVNFSFFLLFQILIIKLFITEHLARYDVYVAYHQ